MKEQPSVPNPSRGWVEAPLPPTEADRLALLRALDLLDSPPDVGLDAVTRLVAKLLEVPIALVSLIDERRQWFKSRAGLAATETPREMAFCAHAILDNAPFIVEDAHTDARFYGNPLVLGEPHVRAYAGIPLTTADGLAMGTLCAIDRQPRRFSAEQLQALQDLAVVVRRDLLHREAALRARELAERSLRAVSDSEALYHATFERAAIGIAIVSLDGGWLRINPAVAEMLGRTREQLDGMTFQDVTHPDDLDLDLGHMRQLLAGTARHYTLEKRYLRPDGSVVWGNLTVTLVTRDGRPHHFIAIIEDITARRAAELALRDFRDQLERRVAERTAELHAANGFLLGSMKQLRQSEAALEQSEAELRSVLENALDAFISIDSSSVVLEWNRQAEITFGWSRQEAVGQRLDQLILPPAHREGHRTGIKRLDATGEALVLNRRLELPALRRDGTQIPCEVTITALPSLSKGQVYAAFLHDISERKRAQQTLADSERRLDAVVNDVTDPIFRFDARGRVVFANAASRALFGLQGDGPWEDDWRRAVHPEDLPAVLATVRRLSPRQPLVLTEHRMISAAGGVRWVEFVNRGFYDAQGKLCEVQIIGRDVTQRKTLEARLEATNREQALMLDNEVVGILRLKNRTALWCNRAFETLFGFGPGEFVGQSMRGLYRDPEAFDLVGTEGYAALQGGGTYRTQVEMVRRDGTPIWVDLSGALLSPETGESMWLVADITAMKQRQALMENLAFHDALTGLPNRRLLNDRLVQALAQAERAHKRVAVGFIDLDGFKAINDRHGHDAGDLLLKTVSARLQECVRAEDTVARLGGDEFVVMLPLLTESEDPGLVFERLLSALRDPVPLTPGQTGHVSGSVGLALYPQDGHEGDTLLAVADERLYQAKRAGKDRIVGL